MPPKAHSTQPLTVKAYRGDAKTLLAFNLPDRASAKDLAGFTIQCQPPGQPAFYLQNNLRFEVPGQHAQVATEPATSSINAPFHKFRWLHIPGTFQGTKPTFGPNVYTVTPRFFDGAGALLPIDRGRSVSVTVDVQPFKTKGLELGFTRGFMQSQAFVHHFGLKAVLRPKGNELQFDTSAVSGTNNQGQTYTFAEEYDWSGFTARAKIFGILNEVLNDKSLHLDVFAYDLNEPDVIAVLLQLAKQGRVRVILDDAALHHSGSSPRPEDEFEALFTKAAQRGAAILRGHFKRYAHDKVFIVSKNSAATKVLTGSTNFSVTGMYVNANHVLVFNDPKVAAKYQDVFNASWSGNVKGPAFLQDPLSAATFNATSKLTPQSEITFSPHASTFAEQILDGLVARIQQEEKTAHGSVLFAVMEIGTGTGPVYPALQKLHENQQIFSYGISDTTSGIELYAPGKTTGVLVTGKPTKSQLPPPFDQVPVIPGVGHQVHHKFVVCGFNGNNPVTYCGSSNLALGGEESNGDNLIAIHDGDVATVFAIEALALVDHFEFLDRSATTKPKAPKRAPKFASKQQLAVSAGWFLSTTDQWAAPYFNPGDLHCVDRELFG
ncbi:MAG: phospholipase D-like domain-containing protein [Isosphaeraceae bacterium]|nr:phospholipase D-like domain-containing protein [Isosphaeraceae bacterium]